MIANVRRRAASAAIAPDAAGASGVLLMPPWWQPYRPAAATGLEWDAMSDLHARDSPHARVVIAGGGIAAVETLLALRAAPRGGELDVTVVSPGGQLEYRPLSVLEPFGPAPVRRYPLDRICA